jgi:hypothetical protein
MQRNSEIHLVGRRDLHAATNAALEDVHPLTNLNPQDIVRETLNIAHECGEALAEVDIKKDQLLVELVSSLVVVRLRKAGA